MKARVTSDSGAMTTSVRVTVTSFKGTAQELKKAKDELYSFIDKFRSGDFNGMIDLYEMRSRNDDLPEVKYVFLGFEENVYFEALKRTEHELFYCPSREKVFAYTDGDPNFGKVATIGAWRKTEEEAINYVNEQINQAA